MSKPFIALFVCASFLAACAEQGKESSGDAIAAATHAHAGPPKLTLITMINNRTGAGAHSALLVEGTQSVIFDPAGSFIHEAVPERGDVLYGMSPAWVRAYKSAHARSEFHVVSQSFDVTPAQAARALQLVEGNGAVATAHCAHSISGILGQIPGFQSVRQGYYPLKLMDQLDAMSGVQTTRHFEDDDGGVLDGIEKASAE
jgi:hypothetical protein